MPRIRFIVLLCAGLSLGGPALADNPCLTTSSDPAVSFPDGSYDYIFVITADPSAGYTSCFYSPTTLDLSTFVGGGVTDINQDGWLDLAFGTGGSSGGQVDLFMNDATGSGIVVHTTTLLTGAAHAPLQVRSLDLDGDGVPDILTGNGIDGTFSVMLNDGAGAFSAVKQYAVGSFIPALDVEDLDGDGYLDVVSIDNVGNTVDVSLNTGTGDFAAPAVIPVGAGPYAMQVRDLDNDGAPDIVTLNTADKTVSVLINDGDGTFATPASYPVTHTTFVSLIDVNNDGRLDILTDFTNGFDYALVNNGDGSFAPAAWIPMPGGSSGGVVITIGNSGGLTSGSGSPVTPIYSSGSGTVIPPTTTTSITITSNGSSSSGGNSGTGSEAPSSNPARGASADGGGAMEWFSLMLLGLTGFLRKKHS